jgi:hypothetical protein
MYHRLNLTPIGKAMVTAKADDTIVLTAGKYDENLSLKAGVVFIFIQFIWRTNC